MASVSRRTWHWVGIVAVLAGLVSLVSPWCQYAVPRDDLNDLVEAIGIAVVEGGAAASGTLSGELRETVAAAPIDAVDEAVARLPESLRTAGLELELERAAVPVPTDEHVALMASGAHEYPLRPLPEELARLLGATASAWVRFGRAQRWWTGPSACWPADTCALEERTRRALIELRELLERASTRAEPLLELRAALRSDGPACSPESLEEPLLAAIQHMAELQWVDVGNDIGGCDVLHTLYGETPLGREPRNGKHLRVFDTDEVVRLGPWGDPAWDEAPSRVVSFHRDDVTCTAGGPLALLQVDGLWRVVGRAGPWYRGYQR